jgi:predicted Rossmann fold nucleotide-binding protein DprA/Smf involved in DNA uptake
VDIHDSNGTAAGSRSLRGVPAGAGAHNFQMTEPTITSRTDATLLLCAQLKPGTAATPLSAGEFHRLGALLAEHERSPVDLLDARGVADCLQVLRESAWDAERVARLLDRGAAVAIARDRWSQAGIWVMAHDEADYPRPWTARLGPQAPPLMFGVGDVRLGQRDGYAIVGSRAADEAALAFAATLAALCAKQDLAVISGGAKGIDQAAMSAALDAGGAAVGILSDGLARAGVAGANRDALERRTLLLVSPYSPDAPFHVGAAMGRNKLIYALAQASFVIASDAQTGGTWSGATENLKAKWSLLIVRDGDGVPAGNSQLIKRGGLAFPAAQLTGDLDLRTWCAGPRADVDGEAQTSLFS